MAKKVVKKAPKKKASSKPLAKRPTDTGKAPGREVIYPDYDVQLCIGPDALTADKAKKLLGWREEPEGSSWKEDYFVKDLHGKKIKTHNNTINVPFVKSNMLEVKQEILSIKSDGKRAWNFNGEPIIVGKTGQILNGQHVLTALILACQEVELYPGRFEHWQDTAPTVDKLVVFGVDEDDDTVNTLDTCRGRTQADVIYRSELFDDKPPKERKVLSRICKYAVNTVWERTGAANAFAPRQTSSVMMDFLRTHCRLLECVEDIFVENGSDNHIGKLLPLGYAAGMMYLMASSESDAAKYKANPCDDSLDWSNWDKAYELFVHIGQGHKLVTALRTKLLQMLESEEGASRKERFALLAKAWWHWAKHPAKEIPAKALTLDYAVQDGVRTLAEEPDVGGIDLLEYDG